ncbi:MAG: flagellar motor switch protein FliN [Planctomycetales bacterium 12-60-4]|nr:MAG: flagellar motor switch protein FliN [Planctomycetales bacterium 12-60-4]
MSAARVTTPATPAAKPPASKPAGTKPVAPAAKPAAAATPDQILQDVENHLADALGTGSSRSRSPDIGAASRFEYEDFGRPSDREAAPEFPIAALQDVELDLRIELGRTELLIEEVLQLREGTVVPLDKLAGDPVDILVNGRLIARGEVLVLNDNFCVRVAEIVSPKD